MQSFMHYNNLGDLPAALLDWSSTTEGFFALLGVLLAIVAMTALVAALAGRDAARNFVRSAELNIELAHTARVEAIRNAVYTTRRAVQTVAPLSTPLDFAPRVARLVAAKREAERNARLTSALASLARPALRFASLGADHAECKGQID